MVYKVGSAVGAVGTVGGIGGTVVMANRETEPTKEQALKALSKEKGIEVSAVVSSIPGVGESKLEDKETDIKTALEKIKADIKDKTRKEIKELDLKDKLKDLKDKLKDLKDKLPELKLEEGENKKQNNLCEVLQKELFRRFAKNKFDFGIKKNEDFLNLVKSCLTEEK